MTDPFKLLWFFTDIVIGISNGVVFVILVVAYYRPSLLIDKDNK